MTGLTVPGNRWDLLSDASLETLPTVSVVVPYFEQQRELDRLFGALARQDYPSDLVQVIVVDDGSATQPRVPAGVLLLRQDDLGFRAAAARNLGARHATGAVLCFLDADTAPEPGYLRAATRLPAIAPEAVTVGRRRHADFGGDTEPVEVAGPALELPEPRWLADEYARSHNLLDADDRSYRYVIAAVLSCSRILFDELGGFDETFTNYGGEDWEWAYRAWLAGAILAHVPDAVAWHDGPEWAERDEPDERRQRTKNAETLRLAERIPVPGSRGSGIRGPGADLIVHVSGDGAALYQCVDAVLSAIPLAAIVVDPAAIALFGGHDHRIRSEAARQDLARVTVRIPDPVRLEPGPFAAAVREVAERHVASLRLTDADGILLAELASTRARRRHERWGRTDLFPVEQRTVEWCARFIAEPKLESYLDSTARG